MRLNPWGIKEFYDGKTVPEMKRSWLVQRLGKPRAGAKSGEWFVPHAGGDLTGAAA